VNGLFAKGALSLLFGVAVALVAAAPAAQGQSRYTLRDAGGDVLLFEDRRANLTFEVPERSSLRARANRRTPPWHQVTIRPPKADAVLRYRVDDVLADEPSSSSSRRRLDAQTRRRLVVYLKTYGLNRSGGQLRKVRVTPVGRSKSNAHGADAMLMANYPLKKTARFDKEIALLVVRLPDEAYLVSIPSMAARTDRPSRRAVDAFVETVTSSLRLR